MDDDTGDEDEADEEVRKHWVQLDLPESDLTETIILILT